MKYGGKNHWSVRAFRRCHVSFLVLLMSVSLLASPSGWANTEPHYKEGSPHRLIEDATDRVLKIVTEAKTYYDEDPDRYYRQIDAIVDPMIDFPVFARSVMGKYASGSRYRALKTEHERAVFRDQVRRFSANFREGLVRTYGKGLLTFGGQKIEVVEPRESDLKKIAAGESVDVIQHIHGDSGSVYVIKYKMKPDSHNQWKLRNVTIESVNIGQVYRSQFESAMSKYNGDIDKVIETWTVTPYEVEKKEGDGAAPEQETS